MALDIYNKWINHLMINISLLNDTEDMELTNLHILIDNLQEDELALVLIYVPVFLLGFLGNASVIILIFGNRHLRNTTNMFLCNMAVADLLVSLICVPMAVGQALYRVWIYGEFMCKITTYLQGVTVAASIFTITVLSVDRYLAIKHPIIFRRISRTGVALKFIILIWIVSMGIMAPLIFMRQVDTVMIIPEEPIYLCTEIWPEHFHRQIFDVFLFVIVYIVPGFIICLSYGCIGKELWKEDRSLQRTESHISQGIGNHVMTGHFSKEYARSFLKVLPFTILLGHSNIKVSEKISIVH
ncbi:hypothetical protein KUTeg_016484 [Tegillarca granosa]|uniref:G-protein coupled receptors family 1 profile domain-containing protein n=1 Tax=Tegillarca granosa TaxID=220873 RepID=A0ABQ9ELY2_TEGGR|nr:hypothetical protein KUTeg_016484 [Tegillarca granosa]